MMGTQQQMRVMSVIALSIIPQEAPYEYLFITIFYTIPELRILLVNRVTDAVGSNP